ncbi:hypothetical protein [Altererythrobacter aquiaggeris]|uniref:hypothetical protein n=1 Tax=Aestuarierythrobacter aquiaggeris TaxID=1898396 RepID=UPI003016A0E8
MSNWYIVKFELARTDEFPSGSASRSYLIRIPLDEAGFIDEAERSADPGSATIRRFWPNEPDQSGYILKSPNGWVFSYAVGDDDDENLFHLENHPIRQGEYITVTEPGGDRLPYRIASVVPV